ncbi:hypothetical protein [Mucilaginibacter polytrichastri]|nr:hypothetical protein [Mucilaginibacter polytrichastri]SFS48839.1 hypothetical protein SAMN04487890_101802 [Mucilaginibacter polytrichastri]
MNERAPISIEHTQLRGITVRNVIVTVISTISIVISVMTTYFQLKDDIKDVKSQQETQNRVNDLRLKILEDHVNILQQQIDELKQNSNH